MRPRITVLLLGLNLAVFGAAAWLHVREREDREAAARGRQLLPPAFLAPTTLRFEGPGGTAPRTLELRGDTWWLTAPEQWPANRNTIDQVLELLREPEAISLLGLDRVRATEETLASYGLDPALATVELGANGATIQIRIGRAPGAPADAPAYLLGEGANIHVVPPATAAALVPSAVDLTDPAVIRIEDFEARSLGLQFGGANATRVRLARTDGGWAFEAPIADGADTDGVNRALRSLRPLRALRFYPATERAAAGFTDPWLRLTLEGNARRQVLVVGGPVPGRTGERFAQLEGLPALFAVQEDPLVPLLAALTELRDRRLVPFAAAAVRRITVRALNQPALELRLEGESWQGVTRTDAGEPSTFPADNARAAALAASLAGATIAGFVADTPDTVQLERFRLTAPETEIDVSPDASGAPVTLQLGGDAPDGRRYVRRAGTTFVYAVDASAFEDADPDPARWRAAPAAAP